MEEYKFSSSNLDFNELLEKYKLLNTTYDDNTDLKINIYENCNLLQNLTTTFTVPSTNIRLSSFKNNYIIADTQTLNLNTFYGANEGFFTTFVEDGETYINNIDLTTIIKTHFNYTNYVIYPSKQIIININLSKKIVSTNSSEGALQIDMKEIKEHFHSLFDTLELDINQYVTGKYGELENTDPLPSSVRGGSGQNAILNSAGPAINITNNDSSYFNLIIKTNSLVSGGFGASGGDGGNGKQNFGAWVATTTTSYTPNYSSANYVEATYSYNTDQQGYALQLTFNYSGYPAVTKRLLTEGDSYYFPNYTKLATVVSDKGYYSPSIPSNVYYDQFTFSMVGSVGTTIYNSYSGTDTTGRYKYMISATYKKWNRTDQIPPTAGDTGSTATYSNNAKTENIFNTQAGATGTDNDGTGRTGGRAGNPGGITNITATNIDIIVP